MVTSRQAELSQTRVSVALGALFLGTFVLGTAELGVVGMLNLIAEDMKVSISQAGTLVSAYALGLAIGGPVLAALTIHLARRQLLVFSLVLYLAGTVLVVVSTNFGLFVVARALTGSLHGLFVGVALTIAVSIVPPDRVGRAMAIVIGGLAVSAALGLPLGRLIGQAVGWRGSFVVFVILGVGCLIAILVFIPSVPQTGAGGISAQLRYALAPRVLAVLALALLIFAGQYAVLTYITPFLLQVTGISGALISVFLLAYGAATAVGVFGGGRFADTAAARTLIVATAVLVVALGALYLVRSNPVLVIAALILWGVVGMGLVPSLQYRIVSLAGPGRDLAATMPASLINAGIAVGALAGGWAVASYPASSVVLVGLVICLIALPLAWATSFLKPPGQDNTMLASSGATTQPPTQDAQSYTVRGHTSTCQLLPAAEGSLRQCSTAPSVDSGTTTRPTPDAATAAIRPPPE